MRVIQVVAGLESGDGGPSHTLPALWAQLARLGVNVRAYTTMRKMSSRPSPAEGVSLVTAAESFPSILKRSPGLKRALMADMPSADLCHNHGCWLHPNWAAAEASRRAGKPLVISPLGHMDEWSLRHHGWRKKAVRALVEGKNWRYCSAFVAKSKMEADQIRRLGMRQVIEVIPNGIDVSEWGQTVGPKLFLDSFPALRGHRILLFLSRIHPKKGLGDLLEAAAGLFVKHPEWHLVVAGHGEGAYAAQLRRHVSRHVTFVGELEMAMKRSALAAASLFVLPSHSENFGQVVLEALASGVPVITTKGCPWSELEARGCGWWVDIGRQSLGLCLREVLARSPDELRLMGGVGRKWVLADFALEKIGRQHRELYLRLLKA